MAPAWRVAGGPVRARGVPGATAAQTLVLAGVWWVPVRVLAARARWG